MITFVSTMKRKAGLTKEQFRAHYEASHVALAKKHVGHLFEDYRRCYVDTSTFVAPDGYAVEQSAEGPYDVVTTIAFKDDAALAEFFRILSLPDIKAIFDADAEKFIDQTKLCLNVCQGVKTWVATDLT